jgi:FAD/FMN-containing dehydrogenase
MARSVITAAVDSADVANLASALRGDVVPPHTDYERARRVYNAMIDRHPAVIVRCADAGDVVQAVRFARERDLPIAVRSGGHSGPGFGTVDDGLVIDLSGMRNVRVDPAARTARVSGGATLADLDHDTHDFGVATPTGIVSTVGVTGL